MTVTMTYVGLDVHARSIHAAALDVMSGELGRARFGGGSAEEISWLAGLPQPLRGCYEAGEVARFQRPAQLASWLVLVPSLDQSGESRRQGAITKTGSGYARRLLVEAAWHYLAEPRPSVALAERRAGQPDHVIQIALRARRRLHRLHQRLREHRKPGNVTTVAVARELACCLWSAAVAD